LPPGGRLDPPLQDRLKSRHAGHPEAIEGNVPHQLFPARLFEILRHFAGNARAGKGLADVMGARLRRTAIFAQDDGPMRKVQDFPRRNAVQTNEADSTHGFFGPRDGGDGGFIAQPVLQRQDGRVRTGQRGQ
jgi:hypothetical protein